MPQNDITGKVHLIFKTHLDVGFTDLARNVVEKYFNVYIPAAIKTAEACRRSNPNERFVWTTGSWIIYEYLEQADSAGRKRLEAAITAGDIVWHGLPFTLHSELADPSLFSFGLGLSRILDKRFGTKTIAGKMTDVPGHTRGIVPLLAGADIEFLHIGVNEGSTDPAVPPVFVWSDPSGAQVVVMYENSYGATMNLPGLPDCLSFAHTMDNRGPQDAREIHEAYEKLRSEYPNATVEASDLNAVAHALRPVRPSLPVLTEEIGDTWIHGVGSDPLKVARFRECLRVRSEWIRDTPEIQKQPEFFNFSRFLLMVPEHTWGLDDKTHLGDYSHYSQSEFESVRDTAPFRKMEESWEEQRQYVDDAIRALGPAARTDLLKSRLRSLVPQRPSTDQFDRVDLSDLDMSNDLIRVGFDGVSGAINLLEDKRNGELVADTDHRLCEVSYHSYSADDYERFLGQYIKRGFDWAPPDFCKPELDKTDAKSGRTRFTVRDSWHASDSEKQSVIVCLRPEQISTELYGGPGEVIVVFDLPAGSNELSIDLAWFDKPASRLPQSVWASFVPRIPQSGNIRNPATWWLHKLGGTIAADSVVSNGGRSLHAIGDYLELAGQSRSVRISTLDAPLVAIGKPSLLNFTNQQPESEGGAHFNLYNNVWGTNFRSWFEGDARFRFTLALS